MKIRIILIISLLLSIIVFGVYIRHRYVLSQRNVIDYLSEENSMVNILLLGNNHFKDHTYRLFLLLSINTQNNRIGLTFIPPSFAVEGEDEKQIRLDEFSAANAGNLLKELEKQIDLKIPFYSILYAPDLARLVDLVYGVNLFVFEEDKMITGIEYGKNYFDGQHVVDYINATEKGAIFRKYDRILDIIYTIDNNRETYKEYIHPGLVSLALETIKTNLNTQEILSLTEIFFDNNGITWTLLPGSLNSSGRYTMNEMAHTLYRDTFLKQLVIDETGVPDIKVKLLNATSISGLAQRYRNKLMREGVQIVEFGTYHQRPLQHTLIIDRKGNRMMAEYLSGLVGSLKIHQVIDSTQLHDVLILLGKDSADMSAESDN